MRLRRAAAGRAGFSMTDPTGEFGFALGAIGPSAFFAPAVQIISNGFSDNFAYQSLGVDMSRSGAGAAVASRAMLSAFKTQRQESAFGRYARGAAREFGGALFEYPGAGTVAGSIKAGAGIGKAASLFAIGYNGNKTSIAARRLGINLYNIPLTDLMRLVETAQ